MAGRSKITERKIKNLELGALNKIIQDKVDIVLDKKHPLALLETDVETRDALMELSLEEYKKHNESNLRLLSDKTLHRMINELEKVPTHRLPTLYQIINEALTKIQGEPTQRVEVTRKISPDQLSELYKQLPTHIESEDISGRGQGTSKRSKRLGNDVHDTRTHKKGD
jgi:hypothetical protein